MNKRSDKTHVFLLQCTSILILTFLLFTAVACTLSSAGDSGPQETETAVALQLTQNAEKEATQIAQQTQLQSTKYAEQTAVLIQTADAQATQEAQSTATASANAAATATQKVLNTQATATQAQVEKITATAESIVMATQQAQPLFEWAQTLFAEGSIPTTDGEYVAVEDFDESWAQLGSGRYWRTDQKVNNFLLQADVFLSSASESANWQDSSCGFIFGEKDNRNYDLADIAMDGNIYMWNCRNGKCIGMAVMRYGPPMVPKGEAQIMLSVYEGRIRFYVNGQKIISAFDSRYVPGNLAYLVRSGTNAGYGTRCKMTNIGLWLFP